jgi:HEPN domain-containing protein
MCYEAKKYEHALFSAHLAVEKALKALYVEKHDGSPPFTHELHEVAAKIPVTLSKENNAILREMSRLAVRARYADHRWAAEQATEQNAAYWIGRSQELLTLFLGSGP